MSRKILCPLCGELKPMHPEDIALGLRRRRAWVTLHINLSCDQCNESLPAGFKALCETLWQHHSDPEDWESAYGKVLP